MDTELVFLVGLLLAILGSIIYLRKKPEVPRATNQNLEQRLQNLQNHNRQNLNQAQADQDGPTATMNKKDLKKLEIKRQKQEEKENRQRMIDMQIKKQQEDMQKILEREKKEQQEEDKQRQKEQEIEAERKRAEQEEYNKWKGMFEDGEEGEAAREDENEGDLLTKFVDYITLRKVVMLDELSSKFKITTKEAIDRIKSLEESQRLTGVIDDRGKYIYIKREELEKIKNMIISKGRINRRDLILECSRIVSLEPSAADKLKIEAEEKELLQQIDNEIKAEDSTN